MRKSIYLFAAILVLAAVGCNKDNVTQSDVQYVSELKIGFENDTRVGFSHDSNGLKFEFENGEAIEVWEDLNESGSRKIFVYDSSAEAFKPQSDSDKLEVGKKYFAVTSSSWYYISVEDGKSVVPMQLKGGTGISKIPMITDVFTATAESTMATMHHIVGVVEIPVKTTANDVKMKQVGIRSTTACRGDFNISPIAPYAYSDTYGYFDNFNQTASSTPINLSTTVQSMFIPVWPNTYPDVKIVYTLDGGSEKEITTGRSLTVERGKITKISEITLE